MKKLILVISFIIFVLGSYSQTKIYQDGGAIRIENSIDTFSINPAQFDWRKSGRNYIARDNIQKNEINLGSLSQVYNETETIASDEDIKTYLNTLVNLQHANSVDTDTTKVLVANSVDLITGAINFIDYSHHEKHSGRFFESGVIDDDLDNGDTLKLAFFIQDTTRRVHMVVTGDNTSGSKYELHEAPVLLANTGTTVNIYNSERESANISVCQSIETIPETGKMNRNPLFISDGLIIDEQLLGSGREKVAGSTRNLGEWMLKRNTQYCVMIIGTADNGKADIKLYWYEHISKE